MKSFIKTTLIGFICTLGFLPSFACDKKVSETKTEVKNPDGSESSHQTTVTKDSNGNVTKKSEDTVKQP